jgi:hypothetical protein
LTGPKQQIIASTTSKYIVAIVTQQRVSAAQPANAVIASRTLKKIVYAVSSGRYLAFNNSRFYWVSLSGFVIRSNENWS